MVDYILIIPILVSFLISFLFMPFWIIKAKNIGLVWPDMNKFSKQKVAGSGGIITVLAFVIGILIFIAYRTFILQTESFLVEILAMLTVVLFLAGIGLVDDLLGWRKGGLKKIHRIILVALAAIPLMAINAGRSDIALPVLGAIDLGISNTETFLLIAGAAERFWYAPSYLYYFARLDPTAGQSLLGGSNISLFKV